MTSDLPPKRRLVPDLVETTTTSSSSKKPTPRTFAPQLLESQPRRSGRRRSVDMEDCTRPTPPHSPGQVPKTSPRRFAPEPISTLTWSHRSGPKVDLDYGAPLLPHERMDEPQTCQKKPSRRTFAPQLIETAKRSHKHGDITPAVLPSDKTNVSPSDPSISKPPTRPASQPLPPANTPVQSYTSNLPILKPQPLRQGSIRPHYTTRANTRQHSYKVPSLEAIESSESDKSRPPSLSRSNSASSSSTDEAYKHATRLRESVDDRFSGYLLALAARAAEKQLREQEAAVYPNSDLHQPVAHYVDREDSSEDDSSLSPVTRNPAVITTADATQSTRRDSADEKWALREMQKHAEHVKKQEAKSGEGQPARRRTAAAFNVEFDSEAMQDAWMANSNARPKDVIGGYQRDRDLIKMRKAASPPMLGGELDFPRCPSPEHARFDVTQGSHFLRNQMCYLTEQGLWAGEANKEQPVKKTVPNSQASSKSNGGLWGGFCTQGNAKMWTPQQDGLVTPMRTPAIERDDPFSQLSSGASAGTSIAGKRPTPNTGGIAPPSPPASNSGFAEAAIEIDAQLDREFDDAFVTQVFNYLSLGYPALARKFDDELSRISKATVEELRLDDDLAQVRGHLRLGEGEISSEEDGIDKTESRRWVALKSYVREWGRQIVVGKKGNPDDPHRAWGLPARKGSWGL